MDLLNQCVSVLRSLLKFVKTEPELQAKMRCLELASVKKSEQQEGQRHCKSKSKEMVDETILESEKENVSPCTSTFTPDGRHWALTTSTSLVAHPSQLQQRRSPATHEMKRDSTDSGLDCSPSLSSSEVVVASFLHTSSTLLKTYFEKSQSKKRNCDSSLPDIWWFNRDWAKTASSFVVFPYNWKPQLVNLPTHSKTSAYPQIAVWADIEIISEASCLSPLYIATTLKSVLLRFPIT